jgi:hypothetical protein
MATTDKGGRSGEDPLHLVRTRLTGWKTSGAE